MVAKEQNSENNFLGCIGKIPAFKRPSENTPYSVYILYFELLLLIPYLILILQRNLTNLCNYYE